MSKLSINVEISQQLGKATNYYSI